MAARARRPARSSTGSTPTSSRWPSPPISTPSRSGRTRSRRTGRSACPTTAPPYTSTIVFLVRKGNPKGVKDWDDLVEARHRRSSRPTRRPRAARRWNYLAAWGYAYNRGGDEAKANALRRQVYKNVPVLDTGARGSTITFAQRGLGDVLIAWENEAFLALEEFGKDKFEIVVPATIDPGRAARRASSTAMSTRRAPASSPRPICSSCTRHRAQAIIAKNLYRPSNPEAPLPRGPGALPEMDRSQDRAAFGGWTKAQATHFADGGVFDQIQPS